MKILYLTNESLEKQPIVNSQIIPLLEKVQNVSGYVFDLLVVDEIEFIKKYKQGDVNVIFIRNKFKILLFFSYLKFFIKNRSDYSIIHIRSYVPYLFLLPIMPLLKSKIVFDMRGVLPEEYIEQSSKFKGKLFYYLFKYFEFVFLNKSDKIVVVSNKFKDHIISSYKNKFFDKIDVITTFSIRNIISDINLRSELGVNQYDKLFVYSGSLTKWQNFDVILHLYMEISFFIKNSCLLVFTNDIIEAESILRYNLPNGNFRVKFVNNGLLNTYLSQCDIGFLLRSNSIVNKVSAPIKFKDYLTAKVPVIISNGIGDSSDIISKYGVGVVIDKFQCKEDLKEFASNNYKILNEIIENRNSINYDSLYSEELSIDNSIVRYVRLYDQLN